MLAASVRMLGYRSTVSDRVADIQNRAGSSPFRKEAQAAQRQQEHRGRFGHVARCIAPAQEQFLGAIVEEAHADVEQQHVGVLERERIDTRVDGIIGETGPLAVDREVNGRLRH